MTRNPDHEMLAQPDHDETARQMFVGALKLFTGRKLRAGNRVVYEKQAKPDFEDETGRSPQSPQEIEQAMRANTHYQTWSAIHRYSQELMWDAVGDTILREEDRLRSAFDRLSSQPNKKGSLDLNTDIQTPPVLDEVQIHLQPGGYMLNRDDQDIVAGAFYESGGAVYSKAQGVGTKETKAEIVIRFLQEKFPDFRPGKILDLCCSAGSSATPYALVFPEAEVHGLDVGPGLLRYAHARAEAMGAPVHFHQRNVTDTGFPDESFDFVVSHNAMHELSQEEAEEMMRESYRLLKPGGICLHQDVPLRFGLIDAYTQFDYNWDEDYNGEVYWSVYAGNDCLSMLKDAGFTDAQIFEGFAEQLDKGFKWYVAGAKK